MRIAFFICLVVFFSMWIGYDIGKKQTRGWTTTVEKEYRVHEFDAPFLKFGMNELCVSNIDNLHGRITVYCQ